MNIFSTNSSALVNTVRALAFCALPLGLASCASSADSTANNSVDMAKPSKATSTAPGAFYSGEYRNAFVELGIATPEQVTKKVNDTYQQLFYSDSRDEGGKAVFFPVGEDMGFIKDIGSNDIRSEGMSYGMMIAVQMDDQAMFNKLWKFSKTYMQHQDGWYQDYFAWHLEAKAPFTRKDNNPAPDGELYFAMALMFAEHRWGAGDGVFQYKDEANVILQAMVNKQETNSQVPMFNREAKQILFVTEKSLGLYTDPSYHVAAFYELFARWADEDNQLWADAAKVSRDYLYNASHPETGLYSEYAAFDGTPQKTSFNDISHKSGYDAFRVIGNIAMDHHWFNADPRQQELADRMISFYADEYKRKGQNYAVHEMDGKIVSEWGSSGQNAMNGTAAMITDSQDAKDFTQRLWKQATPTGKWRYYDGLLHMFSVLQMAGEYQIYGPTDATH
ncbi:glycosyl hydrolase family 8 [Agarivorans sp. MS3-6]|uniref:glycosyl hydrolase family 8 n=1 Tax=Agarivorans sp. TSD2052 TaxID=2937286 RepID=UPI00200E4278|nr:glycosyl hydrolase family 8 [Agarivorans sp. TSD2052]UPW17362.1 glycosyl hydrolase family 8 [Agarivorans sp. TSD2052]